MKKELIKVRSAPAKLFRQETEDLATPLLVLIVSIFSYRAMSHGGMKPKFIQYEERYFKKPPSLKVYVLAENSKNT
jgi:hypothetical protein